RGVASPPGTGVGLSEGAPLDVDGGAGVDFAPVGEVARGQSRDLPRAGFRHRTRRAARATGHLVPASGVVDPKSHRGAFVALADIAGGGSDLAADRQRCRGHREAGKRHEEIIVWSATPHATVYIPTSRSRLARSMPSPMAGAMIRDENAMLAGY